MTDTATRLNAALTGRYTLERELGRGGMAIVWLAQDLKHDRQVALKVLRPELAAALGPERFLREVRITARLSHPHILPLLDSGEAEGFLFYAMPYVAGESLRHRLAREKQLPLDDAVQIVCEVADALSYAHAHDVIHRDIKPENILLESGHAVVADFGIARAITAAGGDKLTDTGLAVGTPAYMSPEQGAGEGHLDARADVYSLGCVAYEMLAGEPPFTGPTAQVIAARHLRDPVPPLRTLRQLPTGVERAIVKALAKPPADRHPTAIRFAAALQGQADRRPVPFLPFLAAASVVVLGAAVWHLVVGRQPRVPAAASVIAVTPFVPTVPDTALERLGRDLAVTLSAALDGVGDIRVTDAQTVLAQAPKPGRSYTRDEARDLALHLRARSFVHGSLVRVRGAVRVEASLFTSDSLHELARTSITAPDVALGVLTDSMAWVLLRQIWRRGAPPSPDLAAVTTHSMQALREFLDGERAVADGQWRAAASAYARAVERDSTFWLAHFRLYYARQYGPGGSDLTVLDTVRWRAIVTHVVTHRDALPERDRLHIAADGRAIQWLERRPPASAFLAHDSAVGRLLKKYPDYWWGWWDYADHRVHGQVPDYGGAAEARASLERTVALQPNYVPAWDHLLAMSVGRDTAATTRAIRNLTALGAFSAGPGDVESMGAWPPAGGRLFDALPYFRLLDNAQRAGGRPDPFLADTVASLLATLSNPNHHESFWVHTVWFGLPQVTVEVGRRVLRHDVAAEIAEHYERAIAMAWAARGAWDSALATMDRVAARANRPEIALEAYRLGVTGATLGAVDFAAAEARRPAAPAERLGIAQRAETYWLDGLLAAARKDRSALAQARAHLEGVSDTIVRLLEATLSALELEAPRAAARAEELARYSALPTETRWSAWRSFPYLRAVNHLLASRWLLQNGDTTQALHLLVWHEAELSGRASRAIQLVDGMLSGIADLELGRVYANRRQDALARYYYSQFLQRTDVPVPAMQGLVKEAQGALARIGGRTVEKN